MNLPRWWGNFEFLAIFLDPEFVSQAFQDTGVSENINFQTRRGEADAAIVDFAYHFNKELMSGSYCGAFYLSFVSLGEVKSRKKSKT
jgi:hypothetical protein